MHIIQIAISAIFDSYKLLMCTFFNYITIFNNKDSLAHGKAAELDLAFASGVTAVPYHPGAAKFYAEQNITVPVK